MPKSEQQARYNSGSAFHFKRSRLNSMFSEAMKYPLIVVCAGAGYGKTTAVHDFVQEYQSATVWVQLSERDNIGARFWESFCYSMTLLNNPSFANSIKELGFPDTQDKIKQFTNLIRDHADKKRRLIVFDDCHYIENSSVVRLVEEAIRCLPAGTTVFLISRSTPRVNTAGLVSSGHVFEACEDELRFTENELAQYYRSLGISLQPESLRTIWHDTEGWAFALNYIARSFKKAPGYEGYLRNAMKTNIFRFMETEIWETTAPDLQNFLVRLSLIDHLSVDLIVLLAGNEEYLVANMERQNAYVRRDTYINAFLIHPLFLAFLATKQELLSDEQKHNTYTIAGKWCFKNGFKIDALSYYEKIGDYKSIVEMFIGSFAQIPYDIACYASDILERTPIEIFDKVTYLASTHLRVTMCSGLMKEADKLAAFYEARYINLPFDNSFRRSTLSSVYYCWSVMRASLCIVNDVYDFDIYYGKQADCYDKPMDPGILITRSPSPWICAVGSPRKGSLMDFYEALKRTVSHFSRCFINFDTGEDDLAVGEIKFYQSEMQSAISFLIRGMNRAANDKRKSGYVQKALSYILRIAVSQGNYAKARATIKEMKSLLDHEKYYNRFQYYDIIMCWYYCVLNQPEKIPDWLKEDFTHYAYASFIENLSNHAKARFCYLSRNFPLLLSYVHDMKQRESYLFCRIELLILEACAYYKMKEKDKAYAAFEEAYNNAHPNDIILPFIELGKDMRTLATSAMKSDCKIPKTWLEDIVRKSASYAKHLAHFISEYKNENYITDNIVISARENEILSDLSHGLSRTEIAESRNLSINTVKMVVNNIYIKLGAENLADAIRIAAERKIV